MRILLVGDIHGKHETLAPLLEHAREHHGIEAAVQTGDFGFRTAQFAKLFPAGGRLPVPLYAIDGNHDDHAWLHQAVRRGELPRWRELYNLHFQPRASTVHLGDVTIGFLGGALHVDRPQYKHWFRNVANFILPHERARAATLFNLHRPPLLVTHSCPADIGVGIRATAGFATDIAIHVLAAGFDPGPAEDCGEVELTRLWRHLHYRPAAWVFGHFHQLLDRTVDGTRFLCAGTLASPQLLLWDSGSGEISLTPNPFSS